MNVLSLFDGMSCGQIALERAGIKVDKYFASEIDKHAISVTQDNYPQTIQLGDVTKINIESLPKINILIGGSPCQGFSFAGKQLNFEDPRSKLFFEYVRILQDIKKTNPDVKFLLENTLMKQEYQNVISNLLGVVPIKINSNLVSAQNRNRLYWTNIENIQPPLDNGLTLQSILDSGITYKRKAYCLTLHRGNARDFFKKSQTNIAFEENKEGKYKVENGIIKIIFEKSKDKSIKTFNVDLKDGYYNIRPFNRNECERLQTVPYNYTKISTETQACNMLGNGWTVDVIVHIFKNLK